MSGPLGSGCTPRAGDSLPDGRWFGFVDDAQADQVSFDLACWFTGTAAAAAAERGRRGEPAARTTTTSATRATSCERLRSIRQPKWRGFPSLATRRASPLSAYVAWQAEQAERSYRRGPGLAER